MASMSNTKYMSVLVRKKGLALTFTGSTEAQFTQKMLNITITESIKYKLIK